ncbi:hypothetical protein HJC23_007678 [Cyclotella cryptica]|uniref:Glycosyl transferase CAP10 domain-containing protein n=1 Tax=Cyclotella cryptica TaxID=29204 RepID=A0ABD3PSH3_9STRA|eukprot:CCRYP_012229-RA/>CCRYP_012229-RA protein AED:0.08 eAED:-0.08 QI:0/-1/0/1/-1/1/1/0/640
MNLKPMILRRDIVNTRIPAGPTSTTVDNDVMSPLRHNRQRRHLSSLLLFLTLAVYLSVTLLDNDDLEATTTAFAASASHPSRSLFIIPTESTLPDILPSNEQLATLSQTTHDSLPTLSPPKITYSLRNVLATQSMYKSQFGIVIYSPTENVFTLYYSNRRKWKSGCHKLIKSFIGLSSSLRELFPDRFHDGGKDEQQQQQQNELALSLSAGDSPDVYFTNPCHQDSPCISSSVGERDADANAKEANPPSPVLQFGSAFQTAAGVPTEIPMPMPQSNQLGCFVEWSHGQTRGVEESVELCRYYLPRSYGNPHGLVYHAISTGEGGTANDPDIVEWENLIPQVIWRGTDFSYLGKMRKLRSPDIDADLLATTSNDVQDGTSDSSRGFRAMKRIYGELIPRWKGVVLTAEAEWEVRRAASSEGDDHDGSNPPRPTTLPWANIKFSHFMKEGRKTPTNQGQMYHRFQSNGIPAIGEYMPLETLANYKYHIDLGGGGGTTWSGTLEKLALPGLLFHHVTPTKDYFHDALVAWVHYVPIKEDLSDLKQKYEWAEAHPVEAKRIARRGTEWVKRWYGTEEGFGQVFDVFYRERVRGVMDAYRHEDDWREVLEREGGDMRPIMRCTGFYGSECEELDGSLDYHVDRSV